VCLCEFLFYADNDEYSDFDDRQGGQRHVLLSVDVLCCCL
jgi:hypothetical protein